MILASRHAEPSETECNRTGANIMASGWLRVYSSGRSSLHESSSGSALHLWLLPRSLDVETTTVQHCCGAARKHWHSQPLDATLGAPCWPSAVYCVSEHLGALGTKPPRSTAPSCCHARWTPRSRRTSFKWCHAQCAPLVINQNDLQGE